MRLKDEFITYETGGEQIMVATRNTVFSGLVRSNQTAAFIVNQLKKDTTEEQIVRKMCKKYDVPEQIVQRDINKILNKLRSIGAIYE